VAGTAFVTGGARRVGRAIALALAEAGFDLIVHYCRSRGEAESLQAAIRKLGRECHLAQADLANDNQLDSVVQIATNADVDVLVNNASTYVKTPFGALTREAWDQAMHVNLRAPFVLAHAIGLEMKRRGGGRIINLGDAGVARPYRDYLPYLVSKGALSELTRVLALELAPEVLVNCVAPGTVLMPEDADPKLEQWIVKRTPLGRTGKPEDVAALVVHLATSADFCTGQILRIDGGFNL
jgi:pteridine reductase